MKKCQKKKKITRLFNYTYGIHSVRALPITALAAEKKPSDDNTYQPKDVQTVDYKKHDARFCLPCRKWASLRQYHGIR